MGSYCGNPCGLCSAGELLHCTDCTYGDNPRCVKCEIPACCKKHHVDRCADCPLEKMCDTKKHCNDMSLEAIQARGREFNQKAREHMKVYQPVGKALLFLFGVTIFQILSVLAVLLIENQMAFLANGDYKKGILYLKIGISVEAVADFLVLFGFWRLTKKSEIKFYRYTVFAMIFIAVTDIFSVVSLYFYLTVRFVRLIKFIIPFFFWQGNAQLTEQLQPTYAEKWRGLWKKVVIPVPFCMVSYVLGFLNYDRNILDSIENVMLGQVTGHFLFAEINLFTVVFWAGALFLLTEYVFYLILLYRTGRFLKSGCIAAEE